MDTLLSRRLALAILLLVATPLLLGGVDSARAERPAPWLDLSRLDPSQAIPAAIVPDEDGTWVGRTMARPTVGDRLAAAPVEVERQGFEAEEFPPPGWQVIDDVARNEGVEPRYTFSRELCMVELIIGGNALAWAVGGGSEGEKLPCATPYPAGVRIRSLLLYTLDTRIFQAGLRVNMRFRLDQPSFENFLVCATTGDINNPYACYQLNATQTRGWSAFRDPLPFPMAANQENAAVFVLYQDESPTGNNYGVLVDNIVIQGLPEEVETPTPTRPPPTNTPATPPTPTTPPRVPWAYMPLALRNLKPEDLPQPTALPDVGVEVRFGVSVDAATGAITQPGVAFQYGIMQLCTRIRWWGQQAGTALRWQWYKDGQQVDRPDLNGDMTMPQAEGFEFRCTVGPLDERNRPLPVPYGRYEVRAYVGGSTLPAAVGSAVIQEEPPPGKTPIPPTPTEGPEPTGTPGPMPEGCTDVVQNGSFEEGPTAWSLGSNAGKQLSDVIRTAQSLTGMNLRAVDGEWLAAMGGAENVEDQLHQPTVLLEPERVISATLIYWGAIRTGQADDGVHNDLLLPYFVNQAGQGEPVPRSGLTEENTDPDHYFKVPVDVTEFVKRRPGWESNRLLFRSVNDADRVSLMLLDAIRLIVCQRPAVAVQLPLARWLDSSPAGMFQLSPGAGVHRPLVGLEAVDVDPGPVMGRPAP